MKSLNCLFFGLFMLMTLFSSAQDKTDKELVETYLEANGSLDQYEFAYDQLLKMLTDQYPKSDSNAQAWKYLQDHKEKAVADMQSLLTPIYQSNFSQSEISEMTDFYTSETGMQLVQDYSKMTKAQKKELNFYYNTEVGKKVMKMQSILSEAISEASENWSRDLYETAVSLLKSE